MGDYDRVILCHLQNNAHFEVLDVLKEQRKPELFYKYGPELMQALPEDFVDAIIEAGRSLTPPTKILSALVVCSRKDQELQVTITGLVKGIIPGRGLSRKSRGGRDNFWLSRKGDCPDKGDFVNLSHPKFYFCQKKSKKIFKTLENTIETYCIALLLHFSGVRVNGCSLAVNMHDCLQC